MNKKVYILSGITAMLLVVSTSTVAKVHAEEADNKYSMVVQRLIEKFNLNTGDVDKVVEEVRSERQAERKQELVEKLSAAVSDGKITEQQKTLILNKITEWQNSKAQFWTMNREARMEQMAQHRTDMENWAKENNIDIEVLRSILGKGPRGGFGGRHGRFESEN